MNIIIPIGGIGQRFKDEGYDVPKPLINVLGKPMIYRVIDGLKLDHNTDKVHIIYHNHLREFNFETLIKFWFPQINISFVALDYLTRGAAETVLRGLETFTDADLDSNTLLLDCDTFYNEDIITNYKKSPNKNLIYYFEDTDTNPLFSYIEMIDDVVVNIKEKRKISDNANTGAYGFESGRMLKDYCSRIVGLGGELYTSHVYSEMLEDNKIIYGSRVNDFHCVGTPLQLKIYCNSNKERANNLRVCFDLDNTLVTHPTISGDYTSVLPIQRNIDFLKLIHKLGNTIIIYTARRMKTHKGNVGAIVADIGKTTLETLDRFDIPYDEIHFGKPYANFYIDDLAVNANSSLDKALGVYDTHTPSRSFNKVEYNKKTVTKYTTNEGEVYWYNNIPAGKEAYFPSVVSAKGNEIVMEYVEGVNYSHLYVNEVLKTEDINTLMNCLHDIHIVTTKGFDNIYSNYASKMTKRYSEHRNLYERYGLEDLYMRVLNSLIPYETNRSGQLGVIHGDPVFTNVIQTKCGIKFIDMRGKQGDESTIYGDVLYDFAKIYQSILGYDYILSGVEMNRAYTDKIQRHFESYFTIKQLNDIKMITASLLLTLLPLHDEEENKFTKYIKIIKSLI